MTLFTAPVSRRRFLAMTATVGAGVAASGSLLAACGGGGNSGITGDLTIVQRFPNSGLVPGSVRLPVSLADQSGILDAGATADRISLTGHVIDVMTGKTVVEKVSAERHGEGLALPYWPFVIDIDTVGTYTLIVDGASEDGASFQVMDPKNVDMPVVGAALPPHDTPTEKDARGVDPICTLASGTCPFHKVTLTDALASGRPVIYLIGTPAHCKTGTCAPALEALVSIADVVGDAAVIVHAEVYSDRNATKIAPAVEAFRMTFEPVLFVTDGRGVLQRRLDGVFDVNEIRDVLKEQKIA